MRGLPQEKEQIQLAGADYQRALDLYQKSAGWGNATARIVQVQASLDSVNTRLQEIAQGQQQPDPVAEKRGRVAGAIVRLIDALRDKSTRKNANDH